MKSNANPSSFFRIFGTKKELNGSTPRKLPSPDQHTYTSATRLKFPSCYLVLLAATSFALSTGIPAAQADSRGVNMAGAEFGGLPGTIWTTYTYNSEASFRYFAQKGLTLIRVPIKWERIQPTLNGPLNTTNLTALKNNVLWAKTYGAKVIIDVHNYGRYAINESGTYNTYVIDNVYSGVVKVSGAHLSDLWTKLSTEFKNEPGVYAYGLMNEPHDMGTANWKTISQNALTAIRNNGDNKLVMVPGTAWSGAQNWSGNNGAASWISDPANNFMYEAHLYFDRDASGTYSRTYDEELALNPNLATIGQTRLANFSSWCQANGVRGFLGEYGVPKSDSRWLTVLDNFLIAMDAAGFDGTCWAGGDWWGTYPLSVQPTNNYTVDAPQTAVLLNHLGVANGLNAEYYDNRNFTGTKVSRVDSTINFNWGTGSPAAGIGADTFSVRWQGMLTARTAGTYTFHVTADDGITVWLGGVAKLTTAWKDQGSTTYSFTHSFSTNQVVPIRVEYYENGGGAVAKVEWSGPGFTREVIPSSQLSRGQAQGGLISGAVYEAEPSHASGKRAEVTGSGTTDGTPVAIRGDLNTSNQRWRAVDVGNNILEFVPQNATTKRLNVAGSGTTDGTAVQIYGTNGSTAQRWRAIALPNGLYEFEPQCAPGKRLHVNGASTADGAGVVIWSSTGASSQRWRMELQ